MVLEELLKMRQFIAVFFFVSDDAVSYLPVLLQEVAFVDVVYRKGEIPHKAINKWIFQLGQSQDDIPAGGPDQAFGVVEKSNGLI